jgi:hypothetical protein
MCSSISPLLEKMLAFDSGTISIHPSIMVSTASRTPGEELYEEPVRTLDIAEEMPWIAPIR